MKARTKRKRRFNWKRAGRLVATIALVPAMFIAVCRVQTPGPALYISLITALWSEYRLGFFR